jgi:aromatic ring-opening dioxygenase catalytic subunit (LigB family)
MDWPFGPPDMFDSLEAFLRSLPALLPEPPSAVLIVSGHWECDTPCYDLQWPAPGAPHVASRVQELLNKAGLACEVDTERGFDHGAFVPMMLAWPDADVPTLQLSLRADYDAAAHIAIGKALAPLRDQGVLIIGSGSSFHNNELAQRGAAGPVAEVFDDWLRETVTKGPCEREAALARWQSAPSGRECHPEEHHLLPLMVVAGAGGEDPGSIVYRGHFFGGAISAVAFG